MSINKYKPHVWVIPEDDADRQLVNGFLQHHSVAITAIDVRRPAGGWRVVLDTFEKEFVPYLRNYGHGHVVLLIDFDGEGGRHAQFVDRVPYDLRPRVFLVGPWTEPESLRKEFNMTLERIGEGLADDCLREGCGRWASPQLAHNRDELQRMADVIKRIVFSEG